jgi:hypothetical protein
VGGTDPVFYSCSASYDLTSALDACNQYLRSNTTAQNPQNCSCKAFGANCVGLAATASGEVDLDWIYANQEGVTAGQGELWFNTGKATTCSPTGKIANWN